MNRLDARSLTSEAQEALRVRAVRAVLAGQSRVEVAAQFGVHRNVVGQWVQVYHQKGEAGLHSRRRGRKPGIRLTARQSAKIVRQITDRCPDQLKLPFALWTREAVATLIHRQFGIRLSRWTVGRYLHQWGFTPQKPARRALEQNPAEVQRWLKEEYPAIRQSAQREDAEIYWGDEAGFRSDHLAGRSYSPRGRTPVVTVTGQRFGCNMISAITNRGRMAFRVFRGRFVTAVYLDFLKRLVRHARRKVYFIVDRHPVHLARAVETWLKDHADRIRIFYLPAYSPELNPDEYLNHDVKANAVGRRRAGNVEEMAQNVERYLQSTARYPTLVRQFFRHEKVEYAAHSA